MKHSLRISVLSLVVFLFALSIHILNESSVSEAATASDNVIVTLNVNSGITISDAQNITLSNSIGVSNSVAVGTTTWSVVTSNATGYFLTVQASTNPAMQTGANFVEDYSTTSMPSLWSVPSNSARFGFSAFGDDTPTATWGTGSFCNGAATSTVSATLKYYGFYTTATSTTNRNSTTPPAGSDTTICYAAEQGASYYIPSGTYTATITGTATTN